jgi:uncharacterized protein YjbJ (UPF0337 family)
MDENRITGTARNLGGHVQEGVGRVMGDAETELKGKANQAAGKMQDLYGQAKDTAADAAEAVKRGAIDTEDYVRELIEERPYTMVFAALVAGWVIGKMGRRDY